VEFTPWKAGIMDALGREHEDREQRPETAQSVDARGMSRQRPVDGALAPGAGQEPAVSEATARQYEREAGTGVADPDPASMASRSNRRTSLRGIAAAAASVVVFAGASVPAAAKGSSGKGKGKGSKGKGSNGSQEREAADRNSRPAGKKTANPLPGPTGPTGPRGPAGCTGPQGEVGPMGPPGTIESVEALQGRPGPQGSRGEAGATGPTGPSLPLETVFGSEETGSVGTAAGSVQTLTSSCPGRAEEGWHPIGRMFDMGSGTLTNITITRETINTDDATYTMDFTRCAPVRGIAVPTVVSIRAICVRVSPAN
jgi:hypothetical protein